MSDYVDQSEAKCPDLEKIAIYVLGFLSPEKEDEVEIHIANCTRCRLEATSLGESLEVFQVRMEDPS